MQSLRFFDAVQILTGNAAITGRTDGPIEKIRFREDFTDIPSNYEVNIKLSELQAAEPMRQLRIQRNQLLSQTDWRMVSDYPGSNQTEWQTYRQALRDITTQTPSLDENGQLTGITWPTQPND
jgi:hypothetical protein